MWQEKGKKNYVCFCRFSRILFNLLNIFVFYLRLTDSGSLPVSESIIMSGIMNHWKIVGADALIGPFGERALLEGKSNIYTGQYLPSNEFNIG